MIQLPKIEQGDTIGITAPAGKIDFNYIEQAKVRLEDAGYNVILSAHCQGAYHRFSATDAQRADDLQCMIDNEAVKVILCARGGYGSIRMIDQVNFRGLTEHPKWLIGFSDITVIHAAINNLNIPSIHGPMCKSFMNYSDTGVDVDILLAILEGEDPEYLINPYPKNRLGKATGSIVGGNLSIIASLRGTPYDINAKGKILFIEDLDEDLYHIDRIMQNLKVGGVLKDLKGLVVGQFTNMRDNDDPFGGGIEDIILDAVSAYDFPVAFNFPAGHIETNYPLVFGKEVELIVSDDETQITYL